MSEPRHPWEFYEGETVKWWAQSPPYQPQVGVTIEQDRRGFPGWQIRRSDGKKVYVATNRLELFQPDPRPLNHRHTDMKPEKKERKKSFPCTERGTWFIMHQEDSLMVKGERLPHIHKTAIKLGVHTINPGDKLDFLGGHKQSAAFKVLDFRPRSEGDTVGPIEYVGSMLDYFIKDLASPPEPAKDTKTSLVLFRNPVLNEGVYYAWYFDGKDFFFGTRAMALRVIEHDRTTPHGLPVPERDLSKKGKHSRAATDQEAPGLALEDAEAPDDEDEDEEEQAPAGKCADCHGSGWYIKPAPTCLEGYPCDCGASQEMAPADRVAGWPAILRKEPYPQSVEDVATACLAQDWAAHLFMEELRDQFHGMHFRGTTTMEVIEAAGGEDLVRSTYNNRRMGALSQRLQQLLTNHGYSKRGSADSGISTKGLNLVKNIAVAKGLKRWQDCATVEDYQALIEAVRGKLVAKEVPPEPEPHLMKALGTLLPAATSEPDGEPVGWLNVKPIAAARPVIRDLEPGELIAVFTECKRCWHLEFWPDCLGADLNFHACPKCGNHDLAFINDTQPAFHVLKAELDKATPAA